MQRAFIDFLSRVPGLISSIRMLAYENVEQFGRDQPITTVDRYYSRPEDLIRQCAGLQSLILHFDAWNIATRTTGGQLTFYRAMVPKELEYHLVLDHALYSLRNLRYLKIKVVGNEELLEPHTGGLVVSDILDNFTTLVEDSFQSYGNNVKVIVEVEILDGSRFSTN